MIIKLSSGPFSGPHFSSIFTASLALAVSIALVVPAPISAQKQLDCDAYATDPGREPAGDEAQCPDGPYDEEDRPIVVLRDDIRPFPSQTAYKFNVSIAFGEPGLYSFAIKDFSDEALISDAIGVSNSTYWYGWDFDSKGALWVHNTETKELGTIDPNTGVFTFASMVTLPGDQTLMGLTIDPKTDIFYAYGTESESSRLYRLTPESGNFVEIGEPVDGVMVDLAMNCEGELYAHDITSDSLYRVDPSTGETTLIGSHGLDATFAQGMDFDNSDGTLYGCIYTGGGTNVYASWDVETGKITPININDPIGQWKFAIPNRCPIRVTLSLTATSSQTSYTRAGETLFYVYTITNTGEAQLDEVSVFDRLSGAELRCSPSTLLPNEEARCGPAEYTVLPGDLDAEEIISTAVATARTPEGFIIEGQGTIEFVWAGAGSEGDAGLAEEDEANEGCGCNASGSASDPLASILLVLIAFAGLTLRQRFRRA